MTPWACAASALAAILALPICAASAQELRTETVKELSPIQVKRTKNPGDLPYLNFKKTIDRLASYLPPEPRVLDMRLRLSFTDLSESARDAYRPDTWAVAIVGDTLDHTIDVERGGYFLLPELDQAIKEKATIMFNARTRKNYLKVAWKVRIAEGQVLSYTDFSRAFDEVADVQKKIPWHHISLYEERLARFDGLKACFHTDGGRIDIDGQPAPTVDTGSCRVLKFDPAMASKGNPRISFVGSLDIVTLHEAGM